MKKVLFLTAFVCLTAFSAFAQDKKATDFSGSWTLDVSKSKLDERSRIESMTLTVTQTDKDIKVETATKRTPPPEGAGGGQGGGGQGGGMRRGGGGFGGDGATTYTLDGKETSLEEEGRMGKTAVKLKAELDGGKLKLSSVRTFNTPNGEATMTIKEAWSLSEDGKTLTVKRDMETPRGTNSSEMVFTKK
jgi:hypothetical protein